MIYNPEGKKDPWRELSTRIHEWNSSWSHDLHMHFYMRIFLLLGLKLTHKISSQHWCHLSFELCPEFSQLLSLSLVLRKSSISVNNTYSAKQQITVSHHTEQISNKLNTSYNFLNKKSVLFCNKHHSIAISYSTVLGCEQCEVDTASLWSMSHIQEHNVSKEKEIREETITEFVFVLVGTWSTLLIHLCVYH